MEISSDRLPLELKRIIAATCPPASLPLLALIDREFRTAAEEVLYANLVVNTSHSRSIAAFNAVQANEVRAGYVTKLVVEFMGEDKVVDEAILGGLVNVSPKLKSLAHLKLRVPETAPDPTLIERLNNMLSCDTSLPRLTTLFVDESLDLVSTALSHPTLRVLGVYRLKSSYHLGLFQSFLALRSLVGKRPLPLLVLGLCRLYTTEPRYNDVVLLPELMDLEMAKEYGRMTKECEDEESTRVFRTEDVSWVSVYLKSIPCRETFSALLESIVKVFEPSRLLTFDIHLPLSLLGEWIVGPLQPFAKTRTSILIRDWSGEMPKAFDGPTEFSGPPEELGAYIQGLVG